MDDKAKRKKGLFAGLLELLGEEEEEELVERADPGTAPGAAETQTARPEPPAPEPPRGGAPEQPARQDDGRPAPPSTWEQPEHEPPTPQAPQAAPAPTPQQTPAVQVRPPAPPSPTPAGARHRQRLQSPLADERRGALNDLRTESLDDATLTTVEERLLLDPESQIRLGAVEVLALRPDRVSIDTLRRALEDPADPVRARVAELVAERGAEAIADLARLVGLRRWARTQEVVLGALPGMIERWGIDDPQLGALLAGAGRPEQAPTGAERGAFSALGRAVGRDRLLHAMGDVDPRHRLGAVRLLLEEGSPVALRAVASLAADELEEIRVVAALARSMVASAGEDRENPAVPPRSPHAPPLSPPERDEPAGPPPGPPQAGIGHGMGAELVSGLARALADPDETVRSRAHDALVKASPVTVGAWIRERLRSGQASDATTAAHVAEILGLDDIAGDLLDCAIGQPSESRATFVNTIRSFGLDPATLVGLVRAIETSRRAEALRLVWLAGGPAVIPHAKAFLSDSSGPTRMAALEVVGASGDPDAVEVAHRVLQSDSSPAVRASAVKLLGGAPEDKRLEAISHALSDPDPDVRGTAVEVLLAGSTRQASHLLLKAIDDPDERVRTVAIRHLAALPPTEATALWAALRQCPDRLRDELVSIIEEQGPDRLAALAVMHLDSPNAGDRALAVELAGRSGTHEGARQTIRALQDPAPSVRRTAAAALSGLRSPEAIPALSRALKDPNPQVRAEAVNALGVIDDDEVIPILITALKDPESRVRDQAATVLQRWRSPAVARRLVAALGSPDLSRAASDLIVRMGPTSVEPLLEVLLQQNAELAPIVGDLLQQISGPEPFLDELSSLDPVHRLRGVEALGAIGGPRAVDGLMRALSDPDERNRTRAVHYLGRLGDDRAYEAVRRAFAGDPVLEVVEAAEEALRRLEPGSD